MRMAQGFLQVETRGRGLHEVTAEVARWLNRQEISQGLLMLFIRHTSASLLIQENASREVREDLETFLSALVPEDPGCYRHDEEGPDDMPAHIRSALLPTQLSVPVAEGRLLLGTWQGLYVYEHRRSPHRRQVAMTMLGS